MSEDKRLDRWLLWSLGRRVWTLSFRGSGTDGKTQWINIKFKRLKAFEPWRQSRRR